MSDPIYEQPPTGVEDAFQGLLDTLQSNIGRYVAFVLTPILLPIVGAVAVWLQNTLGVDLQDYGGPAVVVGYIVSVVGGAAGVLIAWLRNRGNYERQAVEALTLLKAGEDAAVVASSGGAVTPGEGAVAPSPDREF